MDMDDTQRRAREGFRRYWDNLTPEQKADQQRKSAETRRRNAAQERQWRIEEEERRERKELQREKSNRRARERRREKRAAAYGDPKPTEWLKVAGGGSIPYEFVGVDPEVRWKRNQTFWAFVDQSGGPDACWPWHGSYYYDHDRGELSKYGVAYWHRSNMVAHRVAWMLHHGFYIPYPLVIDHMCETPWCVNPAHLCVCTRGHNNQMVHNRPPELTRVSTSSAPPHNDRWYPFGRKKYDEAGSLKPEYREEPKNDAAPRQTPWPESSRPIEPIGGYVDEPLLDDDEEF